MREVLAPWRREARAARRTATNLDPTPAPPPPPAGKRCAPRQVAAWLVRPPDDLKPAQQAYLDALVTLCPALDTARVLAQDFAHLLRERDGTGLEAWLVAAETCAEAEVRAFAVGIRRDQVAVQAALDHEWSSGQVEGQVNRLKLVSARPTGEPGPSCSADTTCSRPDTAPHALSDQRRRERGATNDRVGWRAAQATPAHQTCR